MTRSSYPYLNVARAYGVAYSDVLKLADELESHYSGPGSRLDVILGWRKVTHFAFLEERERRVAVRGEGILYKPKLRRT